MVMSVASSLMFTVIPSWRALLAIEIPRSRKVGFPEAERLDSQKQKGWKGWIPRSRKVGFPEAERLDSQKQKGCSVHPFHFWES